MDGRGEAQCDRTQSSDEPEKQTSTAVSPELFHGFDLHGCLVIDDFVPISFCPSKGVVAKLTVLPVLDVLSEGFRATAWLDAAQAMLDQHGVSSLCLIELVTPLACLQTFQKLPEKTKKETSGGEAMTLVRRSCAFMAKSAMELRDRWAEKAKVSEIQEMSPSRGTSSGSLTPDRSPEKKKRKGFAHAATSSVASTARKMLGLAKGGGVVKTLSTAATSSPPPERSDTGTSLPSEDDVILDDDDSTMCDSSEDYPEEVQHIIAFYETLERQTDPPSHDDLPGTWIRHMTSFLKNLEKLQLCAGVVLLIKIPDAVESVDVVAHLPKELRRTLKVPAVVCQLSQEAFQNIMALSDSDSVTRLAMTPIPLRRGDHVYREMREAGALRLIQHHGIYTGNGRIIHFSGNEMSLKGLLGGKTRAKIRSTSIINFMKQGLRMKVRRYKKADDPDAVITRAEEALAEQAFPEYNLFKNNCEHFCYYCKTGKSRSKQVEKGVQYASIAAAVAATATVIAIAASRR